MLHQKLILDDVGPTCMLPTPAAQLCMPSETYATHCNTSTYYKYTFTRSVFSEESNFTKNGAMEIA